MKTTQTEFLDDKRLMLSEMQSLEVALRQCVAVDQVHAAYATFASVERQAQHDRIRQLVEREQRQLDDLLRQAAAMRDATLSRFTQSSENGIAGGGIDISLQRGETQRHHQGHQLPPTANSLSSLDDINMTAAISSSGGSSGSSSQEENAPPPQSAVRGVAAADAAPLAAAVVTAASRPPASEPIEADGGNGNIVGQTFIRSSVIDDEDQLFSLDEDAPIDSLLYRTTARYRNDDEDEEENDEEGEDEAGDTDDSGNGGDPSDYRSSHGRNLRHNRESSNPGKRNAAGGAAAGGVLVTNQGQPSQGTTTGDHRSAAAGRRATAVAPPPSGGGGAAGVTGAGALAYGSSLPVTIPGRFWPPREAVDSVPDGADLLSSDDEAREQKTVLPQRAHKDLYREMRAQARSIQAADDPERLFGERPQRRRYRTGEGGGGAAGVGGRHRASAAHGGGGGPQPHVVRATTHAAHTCYRQSPVIIAATAGGGNPRI